MTDRLFFVVSGEHRTLPHAEIRAILQATGSSFKEVSCSPKLLRVEADTSALDAVAKRSMMYEQCGVEIIATRPRRERLLELVRNADLTRHFTENGTYAVRSLRIQGAFKNIGREVLERDIGEALQGKGQNVGVDLDNPNVTFLCIVTPRLFLLGKMTHSRGPGLIASRRPRKRPVFHPSTMPPKLARCLVNLARPPEGGLFLDPFCGVGGILLEAAGVGCEAIGADADPRMVRGARANLEHYGVKPLGLVVGDATRMPLHFVESIATDPPYGRGASTRGRKLDLLLQEFLPSAHDLLSKGGFICLCCPRDVKISPIIGAAGLKTVESHLLYVHRSLTRRILVLSRE